MTRLFWYESGLWSVQDFSKPWRGFKLEFWKYRLPLCSPNQGFSYLYWIADVKFKVSPSMVRSVRRTDNSNFCVALLQKMFWLCAGFVWCIQVKVKYKTISRIIITRHLKNIARYLQVIFGKFNFSLIFFNLSFSTFLCVTVWFYH